MRGSPLPLKSHTFSLPVLFYCFKIRWISLPSRGRSCFAIFQISSISMPKYSLHQEMPHGNNILPGNCRMSFLEIRGDTVCRFSDDLDMVQCPYDNQFRPGKIVPGVRKFSFDLIDCQEYRGDDRGRTS